MKILKEPIGFITATMFLNYMGLTIIIPVIPYIIQNYTTHVGLFVGIITSLASLAQFLSAPGLGFLSDMFGRRPVILLSLLGGVLGYIIFGIGGSIWILVLGRLIDGLTGGDQTAMYAYIADIYPPEKRTKYYGIIGAASGLGFMCGPIIGGFAAYFGLTAPLFVSAGISFLNVIWGYFVLPESLRKNYRAKKFLIKHLNPVAQFQNIFHGKTLRILFTISFVYFVGIILQQSNFSIFLKDTFSWGPTNIGIILTVIGLVDFATEGYLTGAFTKVWGEIKIINISALITAIGMIILGITAINHVQSFLYISVILFSLGDGLFEPAITGLIADATEPHMHGRVQGAFQSVQSIGRVIAPIIAGISYEYASFMPYFISAFLMFATVLLVVIHRPTLRFHK